MLRIVGNSLISIFYIVTQNDVTDSPGRSTLTAMSLGAGADSSVLGVELLAEAIDSIIMRVQVCFIIILLQPADILIIIYSE